MRTGPGPTQPVPVVDLPRRGIMSATFPAAAGIGIRLPWSSACSPCDQCSVLVYRRDVIDVWELQPDDWRVWRELRLHALAESPTAFGSTLAAWSGAGDVEARWRARLSDVPFNAVIRLDGVSAGMVGAHVRRDGAVELISMWVAPFARGRGVGDAAVQAVLGWAGERKVELSVKTDNQSAMLLYRRHGFADAGPSPDVPGERVMRRSTAAC